MTFSLANLSQTRSLAVRSFVKLLSLLNWRFANLDMFSGIFRCHFGEKRKAKNKRVPLSQLHFNFEKALIQVFSTVVTWVLPKASQIHSKTRFLSRLDLWSLQTTKKHALSSAKTWNNDPLGSYQAYQIYKFKSKFRHVLPKYTAQPEDMHARSKDSKTALQPQDSGQIEASLHTYS